MCLNIAYFFLGCIRPNEPSPCYMQRFDEIICDFLREQGVPGATLCLTLQGQPIYSQGIDNYHIWQHEICQSFVVFFFDNVQN